MKLFISAPKIAVNELKYTIEIVFNDFFDNPYELNFNESKEIKISGNNGNSLSLNTEFFQKINVAWLDKDTLPKMPFDYFTTQENKIFDEKISVPVLYGDAQIHEQENSLRTGFDLLGTIFFFLSRY